MLRDFFHEQKSNDKFCLNYFHVVYNMKPVRQDKRKPARNNVVKTEAVASPSQVRRMSLLMAILCAGFGFLLYINTIGHDYTVDDDTVMAKNSIVTKGAQAIPEIFSTPYRKGFWKRQEALYRPLSLTMFAVEWQLAPKKPMLGHLMNVLIYALTGFVLFITLRKILSGYSLLIPLLATLLFMAHPVHSEVVANIKSRDELLGFLFLILALNFLFNSIRATGRKTVHLILSAFFFLLALLSKESAVTFIAVFPLALFFFSDLKTQKILLLSSVFIIPLCIYFGLRMNALSDLTQRDKVQAINNSLVDAPNAGERIATAIAVQGKYLRLLLIPHPLVFDYSYHEIPNVDFTDASVILSILVFGAMAFYALRKFREKNIYSFCFLYYIITISLVSNIVFLIESVMAERFLYTVSLAFCLAVPVLLFKLFKKDLRKPVNVNWPAIYAAAKPVVLTVMLVLILYSGKTASRNLDWKTNYSLLKQDVKNSPNSARIRYAFGAELFFKHAMTEKNPAKKMIYLDDAIFQLRKGVEILPSYADAFYDLGLAYTERGDGPNAVLAFESAKKSKRWDDPNFYVSSGLANGLAQKYNDAFADFAKAVSMSDTLKVAYSNWGSYLLDAGKIPEAMEKINRAIELDSLYIAAWYNKGNAFAHSGDYDQAISIYQHVLRLDPRNTDAMTNIGNCYAFKKDIPASIEWYEKVIAIDPENMKANRNLETSRQALKR